jgi:hypothetical protein
VVKFSFRNQSVQPMTAALVITPQLIAICCLRGVAPSRWPHLSACEVAPPLLAATQTSAAVQSAISL